MFWICCAILGACQTAKKTVVPTAEVLTEERKEMFPSETKGISSVDVLGYIDLRDEFLELSKPLFFRLRKLTIDAKGTVAFHEHQKRPGVAYILSGEIKEHRGEEVLIRTEGEHSFENSGVQHGWENHTDSSVEAIVVDILEPKDIPNLDTLPTQNPFAEGVPKSNIDVSLVEKELSSLENEGALFSGKDLRLRVVRVAPKGIVGAHTHASRPSFAYIVSGEMLEHRGDGDYNHSSGSSVAERNGLSHWWENVGTQDAIIVVVDIIPKEP